MFHNRQKVKVNSFSFWPNLGLFSTSKDFFQWASGMSGMRICARYAWAMVKQQRRSWILKTEKICIDRASMFTIFSMHVSTCYNKLVQQWRMNICCNSIVIIAEQHSWRPAQPLWSFLPAQRCSSLLACVQASARRLCCGVFSHIYIEITS